MPFKILCNCGVNLLAADNLASFKVVCPECGGVVNLPKVPDPYNLATNAEMITIDESNSGVISSNRLKGVTGRRRAPNRSGSRKGDDDSESINTTLVVVLIVIVLVVVILSVNLFFE